MCSHAKLEKRAEMNVLGIRIVGMTFDRWPTGFPIMERLAYPCNDFHPRPTTGRQEEITNDPARVP